MVDVFGKMQENCSHRFKVQSMEAAECTSPLTCAPARSSFPLSQQTKPFRESRPLPTKLDVACKNAAHKCLAVWGRLVAARLRTPSIDRSTPYWFSIIGPTARAWLRRRTDGAATRHAYRRRRLPWNYDTNRRPSNWLS